MYIHVYIYIHIFSGGMDTIKEEDNITVPILSEDGTEVSVLFSFYSFFFFRFYSKKKDSHKFVQKARLSLLHNHSQTIYLIKS
jgi:hypothetical protein